jgi:hypothetical protein
MEWMNIFLRLMKTPVDVQPKIIIVEKGFPGFTCLTCSTGLTSFEGLLESAG